jgi:O-antigen/teichoic acid export membrane protein
VIGKVPRELVVRLGWTTTSFGIIQVLRFANNVILARLLSPPLLGLVLIVNSIRTGVELLSDVGINQSIVSNRQGHTPEFYDTAWTITAIRGVVLGAFCFAFAGFFASFFEKPDLATILPVIALTFVFTGFQSASTALLQNRVRSHVSRPSRWAWPSYRWQCTSGWRSSLPRYGRSSWAASSPAPPCW